jgi:2-polyprenyl-3-methyl-5-hydroxy-6-metoxy-1,4-benzoquinol methylase
MDRDAYQRMAELEDIHWWYVARRKIIATLLKRAISERPVKHVLDAGCGSGGNFTMLSKFGDVEAFEFDDKARQVAEERLGKSIPKAILPNDLPVFKQKFDIITCLDVIEHIEDDVGALEQLSTLLSSQGLILVTVPAIPSLWSHHDVMNHHFRRYTRTSLVAAVANAGLTPVDLGYFNAFLLPLVIARRVASNLLRKNIEDDRLPTPIVNSILKQIFSLERFVIDRATLPIGLSLYTILKRQ